nr:type I secretion C-terminal target domain-containing protein [Shewanella donghaensis]
MRGDSGNDTFVWQQGEFGADHITDFNVSEDKLDLSDILVNEEYSSLEDLLNITEANGSTTISIDANGDDVFEQQIILDGIELSSIYSSNEDGVIINGLINDGALIVDTTNEAPAPNTIIDPLDNNPDGNIIP